MALLKVEDQELAIVKQENEELRQLFSEANARAEKLKTENEDLRKLSEDAVLEQCENSLMPDFSVQFIGLVIYQQFSCTQVWIFLYQEKCLLLVIYFNFSNLYFSHAGK